MATCPLTVRSWIFCNKPIRWRWINGSPPFVQRKVLQPPITLSVPGSAGIKQVSKNKKLKTGQKQRKKHTRMGSGWLITASNHQVPCNKTEAELHLAIDLGGG